MGNNSSFADLARHKASRPDDVLVQELDGEMVLLNLKSEQYFGLDEVGARMYSVLTSSDSVQSAHMAILAEYDVAADALQADMGRLIDEMIAQGLMVLHDE